MTKSRPGLPRLNSEELEQLLLVTRHLAAPFDLTEMLGEVIDAACRVLKAERGSVWLLDSKAGQLVLKSSRDVNQVRIPIGQGLVGACAHERQAINVPDCYADSRFDPSVDIRTGFHTRCSLTLPLLDLKGELVGVMQVLNKRAGVFGASDEALAQALAAQCAVALARATMTEQMVQAEKLHQELELARVVQTSALPKSLPVRTGYSMHATFLPAAETGGDTYDLSTVGDQLLVVLADATGHGIAPALSVAQMQAMLRMAFRLGASLEAVFQEVNNQLADTLPDGHFVTAFIGLLDPVTHRLRFISGGQAPILIYVAADDAFVAYRANSFPMGAMPLDKVPAPVERELAPGDVLVLLSDGIYEYENPECGQFGRAGVEQAVRATRGQSLAGLAARVLHDVREFSAGAPQEDDITMVLVRRDTPDTADTGASATV